MLRSDQQPALFELTDPSGADAVSSSSPSSLRGSVASSLDSPRFVPPPGWKLVSETITPPQAKRGRGATGQVIRVLELLDANARGRSKLTFRYRPLQPWIPSQLRSAESLICEYFRMFGSFRIADDCIVKAFYDALGDYSEQEIRWSIEAKWLSLRGETVEQSRYKAQNFTAQPHNFPRTISLWLERSKKYNSAQQAKQGDQRREFASKLDEIPLRHARGEQVSRPAPSCGMGFQPVALSDFTNEQRISAFAATKKTFEMLAANYRWRLEFLPPEGIALRDDIALDWARKQWPASREEVQ